MSTEIELLEKLVLNTANTTSPLWVAGITGTTAVLVALITTYFNFHVSNKTFNLQQYKIEHEIKSEFLSALRNNMSEYYAVLDGYYGFLKRDIKQPIEQYQEKVDKYQEIIIKKGNDIQLLLSHNNDLHKSLYDAISLSQQFIVNCSIQKTEKRHEFDDERYAEIKWLVFRLFDEVSNQMDASE